MWMIAIAGWSAAIAILLFAISWIPLRGTVRSDAEAQLQQTMREYTHARKAWADEKAQLIADHRAQIDTIRSSVIEFDFSARAAFIDPAHQADVEQFISALLNKTKTRGEHG
jgi:hypothetical protein